MRGPPSEDLLFIFRCLHTAFGFVAIVVNLFTAVIVYRHSLSRVYSRYLLLIQLVCFSNDVVFNFLDEPLFVNPFTCILSDGILFRRFGLSLDFQLVLITFALSLNIPAYCAIFLHRHQAVVPSGTIFSISRRQSWLMLSVQFLVNCIGLPLVAHNARMSPSEEHRFKNNFFSDWPSSLRNRTACFSDGGSFLVTLYSLFATGGCILSITIIGAHTLFTLTTSKAMNPRRKEQQKKATRTLIIQAGIPLVAAIVPITGICVQFLFRYDNDLLSLIFGLLVAQHSAIHCTVLVATTHSYQKAFCSNMRRLLPPFPLDMSQLLSRKTDK